MMQRSLERIPLAGGGGVRLSVAAPDSAVRGGIVVGPEARGVTEAVWQLADGLASEGWLAVIPHLYHHDSPEEVPEEFEDIPLWHIERLSAESVRADTGGAIEWLMRRGVTADRIGVVGFGLGGAVALIAATQHEFGAAVTVGGIGVVQQVAGSLPALVDIAAGLRCPWLGIYGRDGGVPEEDVHKLRDAAHSAQVATDLVHGCFDTDQPVSPEAWVRTLNWFAGHLR